jgi:hypothetical protein
MRFWANFELTVTLEVRLPGASSALWVGSVQADLSCPTEDGNASPPDAGLAPPALTASLDAENTVPPAQPEDLESSSNASDVAGCSLASARAPRFELWTLLSAALLGLGARRRRERERGR